MVMRQDGEKLVMSCCKKEDIDQIMTMDGCSNNVHPDIHITQGECANRSLAELEQTTNSNIEGIGNTDAQETGVVFTVDKFEESNCKTYQQEHCPDMKSSTVELTSFSKQLHDSVMQPNDGHNVDMTAEASNASLSSGDNDSVSCSATNTVKPECGGVAREEVVSGIPSDAQKNLPSVKHNEDANTRNQDRRKRMKMVGKAHQVCDNQNEQKENKTKVFRAAMRRIFISKAPPALTINLNRFSQDSHGRFKKLKGHVCFKEMLDIQPFMDPRY